jgi:hypothetical protein
LDYSTIVCRCLAVERLFASGVADGKTVRATTRTTAARH